MGSELGPQCLQVNRSLLVMNGGQWTSAGVAGHWWGWLPGFRIISFSSFHLTPILELRLNKSKLGFSGRLSSLPREQGKARG